MRSGEGDEGGERGGESLALVRTKASSPSPEAANPIIVTEGEAHPLEGAADDPVRERGIRITKGIRETENEIAAPDCATGMLVDTPNSACSGGT